MCHRTNEYGKVEYSKEKEDHLQQPNSQSLTGGIKLTMAQGCGNCLLAYVAWQKALLPQYRKEIVFFKVDILSKERSAGFHRVNGGKLGLLMRNTVMLLQKEFGINSANCKLRGSVWLVTSRLGRESRYFFYSVYIVNRVRRSQVGFFINLGISYSFYVKNKKRRSALTFFSCRNVPLLCSTCSENIQTFLCWFAIIFFVFIFF